MPVFEAQLHHGNPTMVDHTPAGAVSAGQVVVIGDVVLIAHRDIAAGELGALAAEGGVYDVAKEAPLVVADGVLLYWDDTANKVTTTAGANKRFGNARGSALSADTRMKAVHRPA